MVGKTEILPGTLHPPNLQIEMLHQAVENRLRRIPGAVKEGRLRVGHKRDHTPLQKGHHLILL